MNGEAGFLVEDFLDAVSAQLDRTQDALAAIERVETESRDQLRQAELTDDAADCTGGHGLRPAADRRLPALPQRKRHHERDV